MNTKVIIVSILLLVLGCFASCTMAEPLEDDMYLRGDLYLWNGYTYELVNGNFGIEADGNGGNGTEWGGITGTLSNQADLQTELDAKEDDANKGAASGYAPLDGESEVPTANLGSGTANNTTFLRGDQTWQTVSASVEWGYITGTLSNQTDLQTELDAKINESIFDAKGDLISATADDTPTRLAVGSNDQVLTADSTIATGLKWATPAGGAALDYTERFDNFQASSSGSWVDQDLSGYGVSGGDICEIVIVNTLVNGEMEGGVRTNGSSLDRKFDIHEAEAGGWSLFAMHVKADGSSIIDVYAENNSNIQFYLVGYWS